MYYILVAKEMRNYKNIYAEVTEELMIEVYNLNLYQDMDLQPLDPSFSVLTSTAPFPSKFLEVFSSFFHLQVDLTSQQYHEQTGACVRPGSPLLPAKRPLYWARSWH